MYQQDPLPESGSPDHVGLSLVPPDMSLEDYFARVSRYMYKEMVSLDIVVKELELLSLAIFCRCLEEMGWKCQGSSQEFTLDWTPHHVIKRSFHALELDDATIVSIDGVVGWDALRYHAEEECRAYPDFPYRNPFKWTQIDPIQLRQTVDMFFESLPTAARIPALVKAQMEALDLERDTILAPQRPSGLRL